MTVTDDILSLKVVRVRTLPPSATRQDKLNLPKRGVYVLQEAVRLIHGARLIDSLRPFQYVILANRQN